MSRSPIHSTRLSSQTYEVARYLAAEKSIDIPTLIRRLVAQEAIRTEERLARQAKHAKAEKEKVEAELRRTAAAEARRKAEEEEEERRQQEQRRKAGEERRARRRAEQQRRKAEQDRAEQDRRKAEQTVPFFWLQPDFTLLGLAWPCTATDVRRAQRRSALQHHPDRGGDPTHMTRINGAAERILRVVP
jgi:hypothetical protein